MLPPDLTNILYEGAVYDLLKFGFVSIVMTTALGIVLRRVFDRLKDLKQIAIFGICSFCFILLSFMALSSKPQYPQFSGNIQTVLTGAISPISHDTVAVLTAGIINTGSMQSIVRNVSVDATIAGSVYHGEVAPPPQTITFSMPNNLGESYPTAMTYHAEDDMLIKSLNPVQPGAALLGTVYVIFKGVEPAAFKAGAVFTLSYEDVYSKRYTASIVSTARIDPIGIIPGLHTEAVCRIPATPRPNASN